MIGDLLVLLTVFLMSGIESYIWVIFPAAGCLMAGIAMTMDKITEWMSQDWLYEKGD